jgi:hypothetical protein
VSNLALIQPQRVDFDTTQATDWIDGLPMIGTPGVGGTLPGAANAGKGSLTASAGAGAALGVHIVTVVAVVNGQTLLTVADPSGAPTGAGVAGLSFYAGGLTLTLSQIAGQAALSAGDTFAVSIMPVPVDITGLQFDLDARESVGVASIALQATSAGVGPTIANGGAAGTIAMAVPRATMARVPVKADGYSYAINATDLATGLTVPAFYGLIHHTANVAQIGQG